MKIENIMDEWNADSKIDTDRLAEVQADSPYVHNKYLKIYHDEKMRFHALGFQLKSLMRLKREYYLGHLNNKEDLAEHGFPPWEKSVLRSEVYTYVDGDSDVIKLNMKIAAQQEKLKYLESIIKELGGRNWQIRNIIEWNKFQNPG
jgi:hypothetical protein